MDFFGFDLNLVVDWLSEHSHWALFLTFLVSFAESLAIVGSIVPGSVTMTAVGILAGSGVMPIDLTLIAAILGAIVGDGASYLIGYVFSDRIEQTWPFSRYPQWLIYGKEYFAKHGGKSVLIGRFVGPLRSIIPVIAGMMRMSHGRFFLANAVSAIIWSLLYVLPGIFIGAASAELSPEVATRLFVLVLGLLAALWLITWLSKWLVLKLNFYLSTLLDRGWRALLHTSLDKRFFAWLTPNGEQNHYATAGLCVLFLAFSAALTALCLAVNYSDTIELINRAVYLFMQSLRTTSFDRVFIFVDQIFSLVNLCIFLMVFSLGVKGKKQLKFSFYLSLLCLFTACMSFLLQAVAISSGGVGHLDLSTENTFPSIAVALLSSLGVFLTLCLHKERCGERKTPINIALFSMLFLAGLTEVYLGASWIADVMGGYLLGIVLAILGYILYRRKPLRLPSGLFMVFALISIIPSSCILYLMNYKEALVEYQTVFEQHLVAENMWWQQKEPLLPVYRRNRIGQPISLFNVQYVGRLKAFADTMQQAGWKPLEENIYHSVLRKLSGHPIFQGSPLLPQLYLNRPPVLVLSLQPKPGSPMLIFRIWRSNYEIAPNHNPVWVGSMHTLGPLHPKARERKTCLNPASLLLPHLLNYEYRIVTIPDRYHRNLLLMTVPEILLIQQKASKSPGKAR